MLRYDSNQGIQSLKNPLWLLLPLPHFKDEEAESGGGSVTCPTSQSGRVLSQGVHLQSHHSAAFALLNIF